MSEDYQDELKQISKLKEQRKYDQALDIVNELLIYEPDFFRLFHEKAKIYSLQRKWCLAIELVGQAINLNPNEPMLYFSRARWLIQNQEFFEAHDDLSKLIALEHRFEDSYYLESAYFFRALASSYLGDYKSVMQDCNHVRDDYSTYIIGKSHSKGSLVELAVKSIKLGQALFKKG